MTDEGSKNDAVAAASASPASSSGGGDGSNNSERLSETGGVHASRDGEPTPAHIKCIDKVTTSLKQCGKVRFLREKLAELGCQMPMEAFTCKPCGTSGVSGGWKLEAGDGAAKPTPQVILCEENYLPQRMYDHTIAHELIHAYDECRVKANWSNCLHHACTEIRASNTSGECNMMEEWRRGNFVWLNGHKNCVKRRAALSLSLNPNCNDKAKEFVESVFEACYQDVEPYDKNPWW